MASLVPRPLSCTIENTYQMLARVIDPKGVYKPLTLGPYRLKYNMPYTQKFSPGENLLSCVTDCIEDMAGDLYHAGENFF